MQITSFVFNQELTASEWLLESQQQFEVFLSEFLINLQGVEPTLKQAMRYSLLGGGKRFRASLVFATGKALGINSEHLMPVATAVECLHAYSLVHDDMPCMDNDLLRRGKPACHVQFGQAIALLVGDALQTLSFDCLAHNSQLPVEVRLKQVQVLARAAGAQGMVNGQTIDLMNIGQTMSLSALKQMHARKTGDLIVAAVKMGYLAASELTEQRERALNEYAQTIGFAYQVVDDILDVECSVESLGKTPGKDAALNKPTMVSLFGLNESKILLEQLRITALQACDRLVSKQDDCLRSLVNLIVERKS